jgi:hypothetical protein
VSVAPGSSTTTANEQLLSVTINGKTTQLGGLSQNNPSFTDVLVAAQLQGTVSSFAALFTGSGSGGSVSAPPGFMVNPLNWLRGLPATLPALNNTSQPENSTTFVFALQQTGMRYIDTVSYPVSTTFGPDQFWAALHGNGLDTKGHTDVLVVWGDYSAVNIFLTGLGGVVKEGWQVLPASSGNVLVLGTTGTDGTMPCVFQLLQIPSTSVVFTVGITYSPTTLLASAGSLVSTTRTPQSSQPLNCFSATTNTSTTFTPQSTAAFGAITGSTLTYETGSTTPTTTALTAAPPTPI